MNITAGQFHSRRTALAAMFSGLVPGGLIRRAHARPVAAVIRYVEPRRFAIRHRITITNVDLRLHDLEMWLPIPTTWPEQTVSSIRIRPEAQVLRDATAQVSVARRLILDGLPGPAESRSLEVACTVTCRKAQPDRRRLERAGREPYRKDRRYRIFTRSEKKIATALPAIRQKADELRSRSQSAVDIARAAYEWVIDRTTYQEVDGICGAQWCLENKAGECGDYSALFVAVCRAAGIPARPVTGLWADEESGWHCWAEFMLPDGQWVPADSSLGDQSLANRHHYFGATDNRRVALAKSYDVLLPEVEQGEDFASFLQGGAWWWHSVQKPPPGVKPQFEVRVTSTELTEHD